MNISISANAVSKGWFGAEAVKDSIITIMIIPTNRLSVNKGDGEPVIAEQLLQLTSDSANLVIIVVIVIRWPRCMESVVLEIAKYKEDDCRWLI